MWHEKVHKQKSFDHLLSSSRHIIGAILKCLLTLVSRDRNVTLAKGSSKRANVLVSANDPEVIVKLKITLRQGKIRLARIRHSDI